jgi:membrane protein implicated in regulation of membrane protease activity
MFGLEAWQLWLLVGVIFIISEIFTAGFVMAPIGLAAICSAVISLIFPDCSLAIQLFTFIVISVIFLITGQKIARRITKKSEDSSIGADRLLNQAGVVIEPIDPIKNTGRVRISQDEWRAKSIDESPIEKGAKIIVHKIDGTHVVVSRIRNRKEILQ